VTTNRQVVGAFARTTRILDKPRGSSDTPAEMDAFRPQFPQHAHDNASLHAMYIFILSTLLTELYKGGAYDVSDTNL
jgi:hypothetical protein